MAAITSNGATFSISGGAVADIISISAPSVSIATIDTTNIASVHRSFIAGTIESGEVSLEVNYDPNSDVDLEDAWDNTASAAPAAAAMVITFSDSSTFSFSGIITGFTANIGMDATVTASLTIKITGAVTVAAS